MVFRGLNIIILKQYFYTGCRDHAQSSSRELGGGDLVQPHALALRPRRKGLVALVRRTMPGHVVDGGVLEAHAVQRRVRVAPFGWLSMACVARQVACRYEYRPGS